MLHTTLAGVLVATAGAALAAPGPLHVPSPDWRDQIVYFVMTDRFADGDPRNNDQRTGEYQPGSRKHWQGGDLAGLRQRLDYIRGLGATALWITPPVANQWWDRSVDYGGYHGYWAQHLKQVDRHLGTLADYQGLARDLHGRGMYLVQDIVLNHMGNHFAFGPGWNAADPGASWRATNGAARPTQKPFDQTDPRDPRQRRAGIYHWNPDITDYNDPVQLLNHQMAGLDDLNTGNPVVRRALRDSYGHWIRNAGVDAFRLDTIFYVPTDAVHDFLYAQDPAAPGVLEVARRTGRQGFHVFGEGFALDRPFDDTQARRIEAYQTGADGRPLTPGMINFPLYGAFNDVFARGRPTAELAHRIDATMRLHARPHLMPTFVDNHDVDRFLAGGSEAALKQALLAMMALPGIPVLYYGTEQGFTEPRAAMFAAGFGSGGRDRYDTAAPLYRYIARTAALRQAEPALRRGTPTLLKSSHAGPGAIAWTMRHEGQTLLVAFNTADHPTLLDNLAVGGEAGRVLEGVFAIDGSAGELVTGEGGTVSTVLAPRAGAVWRLTPREAAVRGSARVTMGPVPARAEGDFAVGGTATGASRVLVVVDGDLNRARSVPVDAQGRWQATADTAPIADGATEHEVVAWAPEAGVASATARFRVDRPWRLLAEATDPAGDDAGPEGRYLYPTDPTFAPRQMDLRAVRVYTAGGALRVELETTAVTTSWSPANGFDHVAFTVFVELPGQPGGATVMPLQNATLPAGMRWHRRLRAHGWSNALFTHEGAGATNEGTPVVPAAAIAVDRERRRVSFTLPAAALGNAPLAGARVYVATWDYDGGYRPLAPEPQRSVFGGGAADAPKWIDDLPALTLP